MIKIFNLLLCKILYVNIGTKLLISTISFVKLNRFPLLIDLFFKTSYLGQQTFWRILLIKCWLLFFISYQKSEKYNSKNVLESLVVILSQMVYVMFWKEKAFRDRLLVTRSFFLKSTFCNDTTKVLRIQVE